MPMPRVRFTVRRMMIAVAVAAIVLGIVLQILSHSRSQSRIKAIASELGRPTSMSLAAEVPLRDALGLLASGVSNPALPGGLPIRLDPSLSVRSGGLMASPVSIDVEGAPLGIVLEQVLNPLGLTYANKDGFVTITAREN